MNKNIITRRTLIVFSLLLELSAVYLTFAWYDWKLFLILFLFLFGNNIDQSMNKRRY